MFSGLQAHASSEPWKGRNALDALISCSIRSGCGASSCARPSRVHGIIREGGTAANIIPDRASAWFMIRSDDPADYGRCASGSRRCAAAAADATGTTVEVTFSGYATTMINNPVLAERFRANMAPYGIVDQGDDPNAGSTDMANVSWVCPTIHPDLAICEPGRARALDRLPRRGRHAARRRDDPAAAALVAQTARRPVPRSGPRRGGLGRLPRSDRGRPGRPMR